MVIKASPLGGGADGHARGWSDRAKELIPTLRRARLQDRGKMAPAWAAETENVTCMDAGLFRIVQPKRVRRLRGWIMSQLCRIAPNALGKVDA